MEQLYDAGNDEVRPDVSGCSSTIYRGYNQCCSPKRKFILCIITPDSLLARTQVIAYNMAMKAYAECKDKNAVARAEALFRRMDELHRNGRKSMKPDVLTVNALIKCWVNNTDGMPVPVSTRPGFAGEYA